MIGRVGVLAVTCCLFMFTAGCGGGADSGGPHVAIRAENLTVPPSSGPVTYVQVRNLRGRTYNGAILAEFPSGWKTNRTVCPVKIKPRQTARVAFAVERGADAASNSYPVRIKAIGDGPEVTRRQRVVCASAPYFKPEIDGKLDDWADAIPVSFTTAGRKTTISTYWSRRTFSVLVAVEEDELIRLSDDAAGGVIDAVQIALSPRDAATPASSSGTAERYEFLLAATKDTGKCFALLRRGQELSMAAQDRPLTGLELTEAALAVTRSGGVTYYECSIPFKAMPDITPDPGREFCFSILVHDPDGTHLRDWGSAAGLWPSQRSRLAWCCWQGAKWPQEPPFDNKIEWGFCSSKH